ncbi:hypothetical protein BDV09DRAFT_203010 [Aspergillus tetrazonus]
MDGIDEADQMPVEAAPEDSDPLCYICSCGLRRGKEMTTDKKPLVLFHPLPWDENSGIIRSKKGHIDKALCATALRDEASAAGVGHALKQDRLRGLVIHARCWQVLLNHKIWAYTNGDIRLIMEALRRRSVRDWQWKTPLRPAGMKLHEKASAVGLKKGDPFYSPRVLCMIRHARRRTRTRLLMDRQFNDMYLRLDLLPTEILYLIANRLSSSDVVAIQEAMGLYFGDAYWRSRIPSNVFHEVKGLREQMLDWEYLCLKLELLVSRRYWGYAHNELLGRYWVLIQLDEVAKFVVH